MTKRAKGLKQRPNQHRVREMRRFHRTYIKKGVGSPAPFFLCDCRGGGGRVVLRCGMLGTNGSACPGMRSARTCRDHSMGARAFIAELRALGRSRGSAFVSVQLHGLVWASPVARRKGVRTFSCTHPTPRSPGPCGSRPSSSSRASASSCPRGTTRSRRRVPR